MTFPLSGRLQWRPSTQTPRPRRMTRWPQPTPTTAATGTTPSPTTTPTPTRATMVIRARPSQPGEAGIAVWAPPPPVALPMPMAATPSHHPKLWWSPPTLHHPHLPWPAATAPSACGRQQPSPQRPGLPTAHTHTHIRMPWARPRWSAWAPCQSWCPPRAGQDRSSKSKHQMNKLTDGLKLHFYESSPNANFLVHYWAEPSVLLLISLYVFLAIKVTVMAERRNAPRFQTSALEAFWRTLEKFFHPPSESACVCDWRASTRHTFLIFHHCFYSFVTSLQDWVKQHVGSLRDENLQYGTSSIMPRQKFGGAIATPSIHQNFWLRHTSVWVWC